MPVAGEAPWRFKLQSALTLLVAFIGIGGGVVLIYDDFHNNADLKAYRSADERPHRHAIFSR